MNARNDFKPREKKLAGDYQMALQVFLKQRLRPKPDGAGELGVFALRIGLEILDMARIHDCAMEAMQLTKLPPAATRKRMERSMLFFSGAILPMEGNHRLAKERDAKMKEFAGSLDLRTGELADSMKTLSREVLRRKRAEDSLHENLNTSRDHLEKSRRLQLELRKLSHQLLQAQEEERMKISRELHNIITQTLAGINVHLDIVKKQSSSDNKLLHQKIRNTQLLVKKSVDIVHRFACELRPTVLDDLGLIPALKSFMKTVKAETGLQLSLHVSAEIEKSSCLIRTALYRVAQEAVTNVSRHAKASHANIQIQCRNKTAFMTISDDGQGMEPESNLSTKMTARFGLLGMRERVEMVGGKFAMESVKGKSTTVLVEIPI